MEILKFNSDGKSYELDFAPHTGEDIHRQIFGLTLYSVSSEGIRGKFIGTGRIVLSPISLILFENSSGLDLIPEDLHETIEKELREGGHVQVR